MQTAPLLAGLRKGSRQRGRLKDDGYIRSEAIVLIRKHIWQRLNSHWWGFPLLWGLVLLPIASWISPRILLLDGRTYLIYLPLALCGALLMVYDWRAMPGILIAVAARYIERLGVEIGCLVTLHYLFCLTICWLGYRWHTQRKWSVSFSILGLSRPRMFWLVFLLPVFFMLGLQILIGLGLLPYELGMVSDETFTLRTLLNLQALFLSCLSSMQLFYYLLRILRKPRYLKTLARRIRKEMSPDVTKREFYLWLLALIAMTGLLAYRHPNPEIANIFLSDYSLTLLLPLMVYGAMRMSYQLICIIWSITLLVLLINYQGFVQWDNLVHNLVFISSVLLIFTASLFLLAAVNTKQRYLHDRAQRASRIDPVVGLPNLRELSRVLALYPKSMLCFIRVPDLDVLSRSYGMQLRIQFKQQLAIALRPVLDEQEDVFHLPGYDLVLRLNAENSEQKLESVSRCLNDFRLVWNSLPLHPQTGLSYCMVYPPVKHLHLLLGELSGIAEISLTSGKPESTQSHNSHVQQDIKHKVSMLQRIQKSLDEDSFVLMVQPIQGIRGDCYHEILLRMVDDDGGFIEPNDFLPVVHEFGLAYQLDLWVLNQTMMFMDQQRERLPSVRFAVNLSPLTLCRPYLSQAIQRLLQQYNIEPYQLVLEVTESHLLQDVVYASIMLAELRHLGCRIAIDDFGTGYASYARLKTIQADILKIDGSFVSNMLSSSLDYQIIASFCQIARMKRLAVVAEYVESEEQLAALKSLGVDYMQGYLIGKPRPLTSLIDRLQDEGAAPPPAPLPS